MFYFLLALSPAPDAVDFIILGALMPPALIAFDRLLEIPDRLKNKN